MLSLDSQAADNIMMAKDEPRQDAPLAAEDSDEGGISALAAAAMFGGAVTAAAGAYFGTRALARKTREKDGRPINSVMAAAITACDLAHSKEEPEMTRPIPRVEPKA